MRLTALLLCAAALATHAAAAPLPPAASFFGKPQFSAAKLSPTGRYLALRVGAPGRQDGLLVLTLADRSAKVVAQYQDFAVSDFEWVNDERLVYNVYDQSVAPGEREHFPGLYAVNRDGGGFRQLADRGYDRREETGTLVKNKLLPYNTHLMHQQGPQNSESVYVVQATWHLDEIRALSLLRLDTVTGRAVPVKSPSNMRGVLMDQNGEPRIAASADQGRTAIHYNDPATGAWRQLTEFASYGDSDSQNAFSPLDLAPDGTLYVTAQAGRDKASVHTFSLATGKMDPEPLIDLGAYDFSGGLIFSGGKLLGVRMRGDAQATHWWNAEMQAVQKKVDLLLPGTNNLLTVPRRPEAPWLLVTTYSDRQPPVYLLYDKDANTLTKLGDSRPGIQPAQMGRQQLIHYKARDGLSIPALLTLPPGEQKTKLPLVVLVHGGPYVRGAEWGWSADSQFLASRGYAVLEPEFRGSTGYGARHFKAGWKQWGLKMQDDLADGARAMVAQGVADGGRICIAGASYGGYAAMMGLVKDGDLYKCGINWAGVTDIELLYSGLWSVRSDMSDDYKQYGMPTLVGDPVADAAQLKASSPLQQAARITRPLLLAYGSEDRRVPLAHGKRFLDVVQARNKDVEWVVYQNEGHGWSLPENRVDFWTRVEKFLNRHIGAPQP